MRYGLLTFCFTMIVVAPAFAQPNHGRAPRFGDFGTVTAAQVIPNSAQPGKYPTLAARRHEEGSVNLALTIGPDGKLKHAEVVKSSGSSSLDAGAILAIYDWRFLPAQNHGFTVEGHTEITFDFHIEDADGSETENPVPSLPPRDQIPLMDEALAAQGVTPPVRTSVDPGAPNRPDEQGEVVLGLTIGPDGRVDDVVLNQTSNNERLDAAAQLAVANWRYKPATKDGKPIAVRLPTVVKYDVAP